MHLGESPFIAWHVDGDTAWIDLLFVPRGQRRRGLGTRMLRGVVDQLPDCVRAIAVLAAQLDDELPTPFWYAMGFEEEDDFGEILTGCFMRRPHHRTSASPGRTVHGDPPQAAAADPIEAAPPTGP